MSDATSNAIQCVAICAMVAVMFYSVSSCMMSTPASNQAQIECIKQRGEWHIEWMGSRCIFTPVQIAK